MKSLLSEFSKNCKADNQENTNKHYKNNKEVEAYKKVDKLSLKERKERN